MKNEKGYTLIELLIGVVVIVIIPAVIVLFSMWTGRSLDFWLTYIKHQPVHVPFWLDVVVTIICNAFILVGNVLTEVARLVL